MATFKEQIEGITGLSIGTSPTNDEVSRFLVDGTKEVINRMIKVFPDELPKFTNTSTDSSNAGVVLTGEVVSVVRHHDSTSILRPCTLIDPSDRYEASDSTSLKYRSKYNPGYYILNGKVYTIPASAGSNNDSVVTQVYYAVNQGHSSTSIDNFPTEHEYLVVLYACIKSYQNALSAYTITDLTVPVSPTIGSFSDITETIPIWTSPVLSVPNVPADANIDFSGVPGAPIYSKPSFTAPTLETIGALALPPAPAVPGTFAANTVDLDALTPPVYTGPVVAPDFEKVKFYIETEEDTELASSQLQKISAQISEYQARMSDSLNQFNKDNVEYQALIQEKIKLVDLQEASDNRELQRFSSQVSVYQAEVNAVVQKWQQEEWTQKFNKYTQDYQYLLTEHSNEISKEQARVQNDLAIYQQEINKATSTYTAETGYDLNKYQAEVSANVQKFSSDLQAATSKHQAELSQYTSELSVITEKNNRLLQKFSAELSKYTSEMQANLNVFNSELQDKQTTYKWMTERMMLLQNQYDTAFMIQQPKQGE